jgi:hypothetical protein
MRGLTAAGMLCLVASAWLVWVSAPISGGTNPSLTFGWLAGVIGGVAGMAWVCRSIGIMAACSAAGLNLVMFALLHLALMEPAFWQLVDENAQAANIISFSHRFLPGNVGIPPTFHPNPEIETLPGRLATALYFMSWGWGMALVGSSLLLLGCLTSSDRRRTLRWALLAAVLLFSSQAILLSGRFAAEYSQEMGNRHMALGRYAEAIRRFERAQYQSPLLASSEQVHLRLGEAYYHLDMASHPNARLYLGDRYAQQSNFKAALAEYLLAAQEAPVPLQRILEKRMAWTHVDRGIVELRREQIGSAVSHWEQALFFHPDHVQAMYFLARGYFEQSRYEQSIALSQRLLSHSRNRLLNANLQFNMGDNYWRLHDFDKARRAYEASLRLDPYGNFRIFKSLGGT